MPDITLSEEQYFNLINKISSLEKKIDRVLPYFSNHEAIKEKSRKDKARKADMKRAFMNKI